MRKDTDLSGLSITGSFLEDLADTSLAPYGMLGVREVLALLLNLVAVMVWPLLSRGKGPLPQHVDIALLARCLVVGVLDDADLAEGHFGGRGRSLNRLWCFLRIVFGKRLVETSQKGSLQLIS